MTPVSVVWFALNNRHSAVCRLCKPEYKTDIDPWLVDWLIPWLLTGGRLKVRTYSYTRPK